MKRKSFRYRPYEEINTVWMAFHPNGNPIQTTMWYKKEDAIENALDVAVYNETGQCYAGGADWEWARSLGYRVFEVQIYSESGEINSPKKRK